MQPLFIVFLVVVTSLIVSATTKGSRDMSAMRALFEWIGASALFVVLNMTIGAVIILLIRSLTTHFVALYGLQSLMLLVLSFAQGFVFQFWWRRG
jgi:hypothetical protein